MKKERFTAPKPYLVRTDDLNKQWAELKKLREQVRQATATRPTQAHRHE